VPVDDLFIDFDVAFAVHQPVKPAILIVPHLVDQKIHSMPGNFGVTAVAITCAVGRGKGVNRARLGDQRFLVLARIVACIVEMGYKTAIFFVHATIFPKRQEFGGQMLADFLAVTFQLIYVHRSKKWSKC
jgi:hypothetical protein